MKTNNIKESAETLKIFDEIIKDSDYGMLGIGNNISEAIEKAKADRERRKTRMQIIILIAVIAFLSTVFLSAVYAQTTQASAMVGYKSIELSYAYEAESELIFGGAVSATSSDMTEKRANNNDKGKRHEFNGDATPAVFGLIGAKFDDLYIIGKIGGSYVDQTINGTPTKDLFLALGVAIEYKVSSAIGLRGSYDSVAGPMAGLTFHFNN